MTARLLSQRYGALPMPAQTLPVLYWSESVNGWWPRINRQHRVCGGGYLRATPPDTITYGVGWITCDRCSVDVAEIQRQRPFTMTPSEFKALPIEQGRRARPAPTQEDLARLRVPCPLCGRGLVRRRAIGCRPCSEQIKTERSIQARLVLLLARGRPVPVTDLARALGLTPSGVRSAVKRARASGRRIIRDEGKYGFYRLESSEVAS